MTMPRSVPLLRWPVIVPSARTTPSTCPPRRAVTAGDAPVHRDAGDVELAGKLIGDGAGGSVAHASARERDDEGQRTLGVVLGVARGRRGEQQRRAGVERDVHCLNSPLTALRSAV